MRVIGGEARGRRLKSPPGRLLRPTSDRIREAIFDLLGPGPHRGAVLDLFAGTGALGIEALSRGFERAVFVERNHSAQEIVSENLARCGFDERSRLVRGDVFDFLSVVDPHAPFELILLDPPYGQGLAEQTLRRLAAGRWAAPQGRVVCELEGKALLQEKLERFERIKCKRYGDTLVAVYRNPSAAAI